VGEWRVLQVSYVSTSNLKVEVLSAPSFWSSPYFCIHLLT